MAKTKAIALDTWAGRCYYAVEVVGETPKRLRVKVMNRDGVMLPGRRFVQYGKEVLVPKYAVVDMPNPVVTSKHASFMGFNADTPFGKYTAIVKMKEGMSDKDARSDAISLMSAAFGSVRAFAFRVNKEGRPLAEVPEGAWEDKNCLGWGWIAKGHLPEHGKLNRLAGSVLLTLEDTQTAAFTERGRNNEIKRILLDAAERVKTDGVGSGFDLHDANGNVVGRLEQVDCVPPDPIEISSGANGRVRLLLDLSRDAFQNEESWNSRVASSITNAALRIAAAGEEGGFLLKDYDGDVLGAAYLNPPPNGLEQAPTVESNPSPAT